MSRRLGDALSATAIRAYLRLRGRYRESRAEVRRLQRDLWERTREHEQQLDAEREQHRQRELRSETLLDEACTYRDLYHDQAETSAAEVAKLQAEIEIFKARDELWAKWEIRERARLDAETARMAAARVRSLESPHFDAEA